MLLGEKLKTLISQEEYALYLNERLTDVFATIFRQVQYISFEKEAHTLIHTGNELTYKELNALYREHQKPLYGDTMIYDVEAKDESTWSMIPHIFHTPFYCYAYAFGNILVFSLYNKYKANPAFKEDYKNILRAGGSLAPKELLAKYGIDISSREFYQAGLREVEKLVEEFEKL
jgi:oligoendopeptidase F